LQLEQRAVADERVALPDDSEPLGASLTGTAEDGGDEPFGVWCVFSTAAVTTAGWPAYLALTGKNQCQGAKV